MNSLFCQCDLSINYVIIIFDLLHNTAEQVVSLEERCEKMAASYRLKQQVWHRHHASLRMAADRLARLYADTGYYLK